MSPDPIVQNPKDVQAYNRYAYVRNNPMTNIDPSGYSWIGDNKHRIGEALVYIGTAMQFAPPPINLIGTGVAATGQAMMGDTRGAAITVFVAAASVQIGQAGQGANAISKGRQAFWHGVVGGVAAELQGGKFQHGFLSSWATKHVMSSDALTSGGTDFSDRLGRVSLAAIVGGTISEVTGGKFANGARTAALQQLFNNESQIRSDSGSGGGGGDKKTPEQLRQEQIDRLALSLNQDDAKGIYSFFGWFGADPVDELSPMQIGKAAEAYYDYFYTAEGFTGGYLDGVQISAKGIAIETYVQSLSLIPRLRYAYYVNTSGPIRTPQDWMNFLGSNLAKTHVLQKHSTEAYGLLNE